MKLEGVLVRKLSIATSEWYYQLCDGDIAAVRTAAVTHTLAGFAAAFGIDVDDKLRADVEHEVDLELRRRERRRA